jgi:hypothetical protein
MGCTRNLVGSELGVWDTLQPRCPGPQFPNGHEAIAVTIDGQRGVLHQLILCLGRSDTVVNTRL